MYLDREHYSRLDIHVSVDLVDRSAANTRKKMQTFEFYKEMSTAHNLVAGAQLLWLVQCNCSEVDQQLSLKVTKRHQPCWTCFSLWQDHP